MSETAVVSRAEIHVGEPEGEPLMDAIDLVAGYLPGVNILDGASLTLHDGEIVGIIGPNGAGKSTLLKSLFGLVHVSSGELMLRGEKITNMRADKLVARGVGFVPQTENVFPSLTIAENMHMGAFQAPKLFAERFDYVCSIFPKLAERKDQLAGSLSGGESQRLKLAAHLADGVIDLVAVLIDLGVGAFCLGFLHAFEPSLMDDWKVMDG